MRFRELASTAVVAAWALTAPPVAHAQDPLSVANEACWRAVVREARGSLDADGIEQTGSPSMRPGSNAENVISGVGFADGRPFSYTCTYNIRNGSTYGVHVTGARESGRPSWTRPDYSSTGIAEWMVGYFEGYNDAAEADVALEIHHDGSVIAHINGRRVTGTVRNGVLTAAGGSYTLERRDNGFITRQVGRPDNVVRYRRH